MTIDYYRTLGVLDDAEDIVIKAAYRALAQRYHPDRWAGNAAEATRRMSAINEAYAVLSDPEKRRAYDAKRDKTQFREESAEDSSSNTQDILKDDWQTACKYFPNLNNLYRQLALISSSLSFTFKLIVLEEKNFTNAKIICQRLESEFLIKYFGKRNDVQSFAKTLLLSGKNEAAKELNKLATVFGAQIPLENIQKEFDIKYGKRTAKGTILTHCRFCHYEIENTKVVCPNCSRVL